MKSSAHRPASRDTRFAQSCARTFGTTFDVPRAGPRLTITIAILAVMVSGTAAAAWQVNDIKTQLEIQKVQERLGSDGTVTGRLTDVNRKLELTQRSNTATPEMIKEPENDEALHATQPVNTMLVMDKLCTAGATTQLGQQQMDLCKQLVNTELAQYRFSLRMFERAKENYDRLKEIEDRRRGLNAEDYANVQYNTNELLALTALMDNDRDRYHTYMEAYQARVSHLQSSRSALTRNALKGSGSVSVPSIPTL